MKKSVKIIRTCTVPQSLDLLKGQLSFLNNEFNVIAVSSEGKQLLETEKREGIKTIPLNMERRIAPIQDMLSLIKLFLLLRKEKPQIVHSITPKAGLLTMLAAKLAGVPIRMHTFTGLIFPTKKGIMKKILIQMDRLLCLASTNIYPEGNGVKNDLLNYKITSKPLKVIANGNVNGIDLEYFSEENISLEQKKALMNSLNISKDDFVFVYVGRVVTDKGINELISAFKKLQVRFKNNIKLILVGKEEDLDPIQEDTRIEIQNNKNIIPVGYQQDVRPYFSISNCLVFPSYREGFPNVVIQAGAMNIPSIVSDINGCNEIIQHNFNGLIIPSKNIKALEDAMSSIILNKDIYNKLKSNCRDKIVNNYDQKLVWKETLNEYYKLLEDRNV